MRLVRFSVSNFRSITRGHAIDLDSWTVLVGPNNEGKSNLVRALAMALDYLGTLRGAVFRGGSVVTPHRVLPDRVRYRWETDYPLQLQTAQPNGETVCKLWFALTDIERRKFKNQVGSKITTELPIE